MGILYKDRRTPPGALRPPIAESWARCRAQGLDPEAPLPEAELTGQPLRDALERAAPLLSVAGPFMNALYATVGSQDLIVRLTDGEGWVMECFGDPAALRGLSALSLYRGASVREAHIGTNAISLSILSGQPQQVFGAEHYHTAFHSWASSAAPVRGEDGRPVGALSISGPYDKVQSHTLGMVMAAALAIEHELKLNALNRELTRRNEHLNTLMESISEGILCVSREGIIQDINGRGRSLLGAGRKALTGLPLDSLLEEPLMPRLEGDLDEDQEFHIRSRGNQKALILNATPVQTRDRRVQEYLLTFKESRRIYSQASRIAGARAIYTFDDILGISPPIREALKRAQLVADSDVTILLSGESGTGKELFAQSIHNASPAEPPLCLHQLRRHPPGLGGQRAVRLCGGGLHWGPSRRSARQVRAGGRRNPVSGRDRRHAPGYTGHPLAGAGNPPGGSGRRL